MVLQVSVDVPRTAPDVSFFQQEAMQTALRRLLYIWGVRHPASGYVQGVNDLVTPFLAVFLSEQFESADMNTWQSAGLTPEQLLNAEADAYWCLCKLVERCAPRLSCFSSALWGHTCYLLAVVVRCIGYVCLCLSHTLGFAACAMKERIVSSPNTR